MPRIVSRYYNDRLAAERLRKCYEIAPPAAKAYLEGEIDHVLSRLRIFQDDVAEPAVLELGCGYGRVLARLAEVVRRVWGIDTSHRSLVMAGESTDIGSACRLIAMDAGRMGFTAGIFDLVVCIQNGISAFGIDPSLLVREAVRVTRPGGRVLFSSYAERFWPHRLEWFKVQADHGLIGEIDLQATGDGVIVCRDGFRATTVGPEDFRKLAEEVGIEPSLVEVGGSSLFCELEVP
jgi:2-polyprenyl-6-hydroxyphenyl methylase/3-demethylubiquinone-9 3-methyltransferase